MICCSPENNNLNKVAVSPWISPTSVMCRRAESGHKTTKATVRVDTHSVQTILTTPMTRIEVDEPEESTSSPNVQQFPAASADTTLQTHLNTVQHQLKSFYFDTKSTGEALEQSIKQLSTIDGDHIPASKVESLSDAIGKLMSLSKDLAKLKGDLREIDEMLSDFASDTQLQQTRNEEFASSNRSPSHRPIKGEHYWLTAEPYLFTTELCLGKRGLDGSSDGQYGSPDGLGASPQVDVVLANISGGRGGDGGAGREMGGTGGAGYAPRITTSGFDGKTVVVQVGAVTTLRGDFPRFLVGAVSHDLGYIGGIGGRGGRGGVADGKDGISESPRYSWDA
ncbi:hypothetical protein R3P38DRAFT_3563257 [Favolaschia claudopus]|uniref:Uncharacterized protein n=1 Tax=Favolaschia claudopus TaxID=2862362 RepID=A0AAW0DSB6_9AGAR